MMDAEERLKQYSFKFSPLLSGSWQDESYFSTKPSSLEKDLERLFIEFLNALGLALESLGLDPLQQSIPPLPNLNFIVVIHHDELIIAIGYPGFFSLRQFGYMDYPDKWERDKVLDAIHTDFLNDTKPMYTQIMPISVLTASVAVRSELINAGAENMARELAQYTLSVKHIDVELCFVIMSFSSDPQLRDFYDLAIKPTVAKLGYRCERVDEQEFNGSIRSQILDDIRQARFIIADMTEARPNCYYELGIAHAMNKDVIHIARDKSDIHFDVHDFNFIPYSRIEDLSTKIKQRILATVGANKRNRKTKKRVEKFMLKSAR